MFGFDPALGRLRLRRFASQSKMSIFAKMKSVRWLDFWQLGFWRLDL